jgi:hypothetical protein
MSDNSSAADSGSCADGPESAGAAPFPAKRAIKCSSCGRKGAKTTTCHICVLCKAHSSDEHIDPAGHALSCYHYDPDAAPVVCSTCHATFTAKSILTTHEERKHDLHTWRILRCAVPRSCIHRGAGCGATNLATAESCSCSALINGVQCGRIGKTAATCTRCTCRGHTNDADTDFAGHLPQGCDVCSTCHVRDRLTTGNVVVNKFNIAAT